MFHTIIVVGNLGGDPEMRYTTSSQAVTTFSLATNRKYTASNGESVKETLWFRISAWGKLAETCNAYLKKGSKVIVEGRLNPDKATGNPRIYTRQDGTAASSYEIVASTVRFLSSRGTEDGEPDIAEDNSGDAEVPF